MEWWLPVGADIEVRGMLMKAETSARGSWKRGRAERVDGDDERERGRGSYVGGAKGERGGGRDMGVYNCALGPGRETRPGGGRLLGRDELETQTDLESRMGVRRDGQGQLGRGGRRQRGGPACFPRHLSLSLFAAPSSSVLDVPGAGLALGAVVLAPLRDVDVVSRRPFSMLAVSRGLQHQPRRRSRPEAPPPSLIPASSSSSQVPLTLRHSPPSSSLLLQTTFLRSVS